MASNHGVGGSTPSRRADISYSLQSVLFSAKISFIMSFLESFREDIFDGSKRNTNITQAEPLSVSWTYKQLRDYLLSLTRGRSALLPTDQYPDTLTLSSDWLETFRNMKVESQDGFERWALVGYRNDRKSILLQTTPSKGLDDRVPAEIIQETVGRAKVTAGITGLLGSIHTHPAEILEKRRFWGLKREELWHRAAFSPADMYWLIRPEQFFPFKVVVGGNDTLIAFLTRESEVLPISSAIFPQEAFSNYWRQQAQSGLEMNKAIARRHKLVLYNRAYPKTHLNKIFPE